MPIDEKFEKQCHEKSLKLIEKIDKVSENKEILEKTVKNIKLLQLTCENPEIKLQKMRSGIVFIAPDFLQNPKKQKHKQQKKEIELYIQSFDGICQQINDYVNKTFYSLINLKNPTLELNESINKILKDFEKTLNDLCTPFVNQFIGLDTININEDNKKQFDLDKSAIFEDINKFKEEAQNLIYTYYKAFIPINKNIDYICKTIESIPEPINDLQNKIEDYKSQIEEILDTINDENDNIHQKLLDTKEIFRLIKKYKKIIVQNMEEGISNLKKERFFEEEEANKLKIEIDKDIGNLRTKSKKIKDNIEELREKYRQEKIELKDTNLKAIKVDDSNEKIIKLMKPIINLEEEINKKIAEEIGKIEDQIIKQTSLDLLYLVDITGSMETYIDNTKKELINVMNNIINTFDGIEINLGFIGYKDLKEHLENNCIDESFTKQYIKIRETIEKVEIGGGDDIAEDIAWAFERALNKKWTSNARFLILVGDAPCHGYKYHRHVDEGYDKYPHGIPGRKDIEESIKELCEKNICLFCVKLSNETDIMFDIFEDIYKKNNKEKMFFIDEIKTAEKLSQKIVEKSNEVYEIFRGT